VRAGGPFTVLDRCWSADVVYRYADGWLTATPYEELRRRALEPGLKPCF